MLAEDWKRELAEIFFGRISVIFWTTVAIFLGAAAIAFFWPPTYVAEGTVVMRGSAPQASPETLERTEIRVQDVSKEDLTTEQVILQSNELLRRAVVTVMGGDPFADKIVDGQGVPIEEPLIEERVETMRANLSVDVVPASNVIDVRLFSRDPQWAESALEALLRHYLRYRAEIYNPENRETFFADRAEQYRKELEDTERQLVELAKEKEVALVEREMENNTDLKRVLKEQLSQLKTTRAELETTITPLREAVNSDEVQYFAFLENLALVDLRNQLIQLVAERETAARAFREESDKVQTLDRHIDRIYRALRMEAKAILEEHINSLDAINAQIREIEDSIQALEKTNIDLQAFASRYRQLQREADLLAFSYETFFKRREEARINNAISEANLTTDASIPGPARVLPEPVFPRRVLTLVIGLIAGFLTGCSLGFIVEYLDHSIRRPRHVTANIELPVICSIRKSRDLA